MSSTMTFGVAFLFGCVACALSWPESALTATEDRTKTHNNKQTERKPKEIPHWGVTLNEGAHSIEFISKDPTLDKYLRPEKNFENKVSMIRQFWFLCFWKKNDLKNHFHFFIVTTWNAKEF